MHPEVMHTPDCGQASAQTSRSRIAGFKATGRSQLRSRAAISQIRAQFGKEPGYLRCRAASIHRSWPCCCTRRSATTACVFVDHGLLRLNEGDRWSACSRPYNIPLIHADRLGDLPEALDGVTDPETKRKDDRRSVHRVFEAEAKKIGVGGVPAQGTLYPDVIESVSFHTPASPASPSRSTTMSAACRRA